jgi:hypothetical protein
MPSCSAVRLVAVDDGAGGGVNVGNLFSHWLEGKPAKPTDARRKNLAAVDAAVEVEDCPLGAGWARLFIGDKAGQMRVYYYHDHLKTHNSPNGPGLSFGCARRRKYV